ncbi:hypothetical protein [Cryptosporangium aurantiacum]|uniref:Probable extracellular repeat, HAF family n=1 Tax=Cryptosporangium aurantiacum TaxID=134849 RepID=A0A1M7R1X2_9ACTN|nr:hypothetical protein [Cryptosporangium aurantiacum]SHN38704.1 probable extracellular repeat, HAF family [Cryptosporangium aurantiacum]
MSVVKALGAGLVTALVVAAVAAPAAAAPKPPPPRIALTDLGKVSGHEARGIDVNSRGDVIGMNTIDYDPVQVQQAFRIRGGRTELIGGAAEYVLPVDLNSRGQAVLTTTTPGGSGREVQFWGLDGSRTRINPAGTSAGDAAALNDSGTVAFTYSAPGGEPDTLALWRGGRILHSHQFPGGRLLGLELTNAGLVTGYVVTGPRFQVFQWDGGPVRYIGDGENYRFRDVGRNGELVGSDAALRPQHTVRGRVRQLPMPTGLSTGQARDIDNHGRIVGWADAPDGTWRALLWSGGQVRELGTLGGRSARAWFITDSGLIFGESEDAAGIRRPVVWWRGAITALPLPADSRPDQPLIGLTAAADIAGGGRVLADRSFTGGTTPVVWTVSGRR